MPRFRSDDPWRVLWRIVTSDYLLGLVCLVVALALLLAAWLPQMDSEGLTFNAAWHAEVQSRFGEDAWFDASRTLLQRVGAFNVAEAAWFRLALALLTLALLVRFVEHVERFWLNWQREPPPNGIDWFKMEVDTLEDIIEILRQRRFRIARALEDKGGEADAQGLEDQDFRASDWVRVDRWPWSDLGPLAVYFGGLMVLVGVAITALWGWQTGPLHLTAGQSVPLEQGDDLVLHLESLAPDGRCGMGEIRREVGAIAGGTRISAGELAVGAPLSGGGVGVYLVGSGAALQVQATSTRTLELAKGPGRATQEQLVLTFTEENPRHLVGVPEAGLVLLLAMSQPLEEDMGLQFQVFESGSGQFVLSVDSFTDEDLVVGDISFSLKRMPYADVRVIYDPGAFWSQLGLVFLAIGGLLWMIWSPKRWWLRHSVGEQDAGISDGIEVAGDIGGLPSGLLKEE